MATATQLKSATPSVRDQVSAQEWQARCDLAAAYRMIARRGWDSLIYTHISARVPGSDDHFLINPFGFYFHEITASSLVKVDADCNVLMETPYTVNPAGFIIHSAIHHGRANAGCVLHLHTPAGIGVSTQKHGLLPITQSALLFYGNIAYHDYEGLAVEGGERERLVADLGDKCAMLLRNHGTLTVGETVAQAYVYMEFLEWACQAQVAALAGGGDLVALPADVQERVTRQAQRAFKTAGVMEWPGILRLLDRHESDYKS